LHLEYNLFDEFALRLLLFIKTIAGRWFDMSSCSMCVVHGWVTLLVYMWSSNVALVGVMRVGYPVIGI